MRTEEQKVLQTLMLVLGGKPYEVKPLVIRESRAWRRSLSEVLGGLPRYFGITTDTPDKFKDALDALMVTMPDKAIDLVFDYAKELNREEIESVATDAEIAKAFEQIVEVAFPLARGLVGAMGKVSQ